MRLTVTLNEIRTHNPCTKSWLALLTSLGKTKADDTPVSLTHILDLLGLDDAFWALRALPKSMENNVRLLVCDLVEPVLQHTDDPRPAEAVAVARKYARGEATLDELVAAGTAARVATDEPTDAPCDASLYAGRCAARAAARAAADELTDVPWATILATARAVSWAARPAAPDEPYAARVPVLAAAMAKQETVLREWIERTEKDYDE